MEMALATRAREEATRGPGCEAAEESLAVEGDTYDGEKREDGFQDIRSVMGAMKGYSDD